MFPDSSARRSFKTEQNFTDLKSEMSGKFLTAYKEKQKSYPYQNGQTIIEEQNRQQPDMKSQISLPASQLSHRGNKVNIFQ
tara:strand:+ start:1318 stop:1560 length:243 start_codon:yes stop_codon:yes gene_type:complete